MSRIRTRDCRSSDLVLHEEFFYGTTYPSFSSDVTVRSEDIFNGMVDEEVPQFHTLKKKGQLFFNPMVQESLELRGTPIGIRCSAWYGARNDHGTLVPRGLPVSGLTQSIVLNDSYASYMNAKNFLESYGTRDRDIALAKSWSKMDRTVLQLIATLGEGTETLATIAKLLRRFIAFFKFLNTREESLLSKALGGSKRARSYLIQEARRVSPADEWMEIRYALRPLIYELASAFDLLNVKLSQLERITERGYSSSVTTSSSDVLHMYDAWTGIKYRSTIETVRRCRAGILFGFVGDRISWKEILGLDRQFSSAVELARLSFALDWIINLSDFISSWEENSSAVIHGSWFKDEILVTQILHSPSAICTWSQFGYVNVEASVDATTWRISKWLAYREPKAPRPATPSVKIRLDWLKIIDLAIILRQLVTTRL